MKFNGATPSVFMNVATVGIQDDIVGDYGWSSRNIIDRLCPAFTEKGRIVTCEPVGGYPLIVNAGAETTKIIRCGKNLFDNSKKVAEVSYKNDDESVATRWGLAFYLPAGKYTLHVDKVTTSPSDKWIYCCVINAAGYFQKDYHLWVGQQTYIKTIDLKEGEAILVYNGSSVGTESASQNLLTKHFNIQIEFGVTKTDWEQYVGEEFAFPADIPALYGINTLYADAGEINVYGRADPVAIIEKLTNAILATGGNV